jgi:SAM-dependent methyltransferase
MTPSTAQPHAPLQAPPRPAATAPLKITYEGPDLGDYAALDRDRFSYIAKFRELLYAEDRIRGRVLDIGCGGEFPPPTRDLDQVAAQVDGVDPMAAVHGHPGLTLRWEGKFSDVDIPRQAYDLAYAFNVVEHIERARPFFETVRQVLKPGGVFWAHTPHGHHPFCTLSRALEVLGFKKKFAEGNEFVNDYPAYYRMNTAAQVLLAIEGLGFSSARFVYLPCINWDLYFPRALRWGPHLYDRVLGSRFNRFKIVIAYRLELPA